MLVQVELSSDPLSKVSNSSLVNEKKCGQEQLSLSSTVHSYVCHLLLSAGILNNFCLKK